MKVNHKHVIAASILAVVLALLLIQIQPVGTSTQHEFVNPSLHRVGVTNVDNDQILAEVERVVTLESTQFPIIVHGIYFLFQEGNGADRMTDGETLSLKKIKIKDSSNGDREVFNTRDLSTNPNSIIIETGSTTNSNIMRSLAAMPGLIASTDTLGSKEYDAYITLGYLFPLAAENVVTLEIALDTVATDPTRNGWNLDVVFIVEAPEGATLRATTGAG